MAESSTLRNDKLIAGGCTGINDLLIYLRYFHFSYISLLFKQDVLREKQQHIEQLLKERDLERTEITKAANQVEEAERKLFALKSEYDRVSLYGKQIMLLVLSLRFFFLV